MAFEHQKKGDFEKAIAIYQKELQLNDKQPDIWHLMALCYINQNNFANAIQPLLKAIELEPGCIVFHSHLANLYKKTKTNGKS